MLSSAIRRVLPLIFVFNMCLFAAQDPPQDIETVKIDTDLVTVPVVATRSNPKNAYTSPAVCVGTLKS